MLSRRRVPGAVLIAEAEPVGHHVVDDVHDDDVDGNCCDEYDEYLPYMLGIANARRAWNLVFYNRHRRR